MAEKGTRDLKVGVKVNKEQVKAEFEQLKNMIQSTFKGVPQSVTKLSNALKAQSDAAKNLTQTTSQLKTKMNELVEGNRKVADSQKQNLQNLMHLNEGIKGYIMGMTNLLAIQARWYGAKAVLFAVFEAPQSFIKSGLEYTTLLDTWNAKLLRWGASSGQVTEQAKKDISGLLMEMRKTVLEIPIDFEKLGEAVEGFIGAGIDPTIIKEMTKNIAALAATAG